MSAHPRRAALHLQCTVQATFLLLLASVLTRLHNFWVHVCMLSASCAAADANYDCVPAGKSVSTCTNRPAGEPTVDPSHNFLGYGELLLVRKLCCAVLMQGACMRGRAFCNVETASCHCPDRLCCACAPAPDACMNQFSAVRSLSLIMLTILF